ncbi:hypothetical protein HYQ45_013034 [Verticillium longisporum]|uniref:Ecp2 effector protein-like domain-containing protein n=1 Tax=Verticillium longisporum TaxID=100787 RepID=A0A8I2ZDA0_VERLO|nr:hypothetical protein HYQ45_013034 [Verticillium longisporum]
MFAQALLALTLGASSFATASALPPQVPDGDVIPLPASLDVNSVDLHNFTASDGNTYTVWVAKMQSPEDVQPTGADDDSNLARRWQWEHWPNGVDACGAASFRDETSNGSPLTDHCICVRDYARDQLRGRWAFGRDDKPNNGWFNLVGCGECGFRVYTDNFFGAFVGDTDVRDLSTDSINRYNRGGRVGAGGDMGCRNWAELAKVHWSVFRQ